MGRLIFLATLCSLFCTVSAVRRFSTNDSVQHRLRSALLMHYHDDSIRPVRRPTDTVNVTIECVLYQISDVDQVGNAIKLTLGLKMRWNDVFLQWDPPDYDGVEQVFLPAHKVWTPELSVWYSTDRGSIQVPSDDLDIRVRFDGQMYYFVSFTSQSLCPFDVKKFPFDVQECNIVFGSLIHDNLTLELSVTNEVILTSFYDHQEWMLDNATFEKDYYTLSKDDPAPYSIARLKLLIRRQPFFYIFTLVVPAALITFVAIVGFHTPFASRPVRYAKFQIGVVTLMSMSVLMLTIANDMPRFSIQKVEGQRGSFSSIPLLALYYFALVTLVGLSTVTSSLLVIWDRQLRFAEKTPWTVRMIERVIDLLWKPHEYPMHLERSQRNGSKASYCFDSGGNVLNNLTRPLIAESLEGPENVTVTATENSTSFVRPISSAIDSPAAFAAFADHLHSIRQMLSNIERKVDVVTKQRMSKGRAFMIVRRIELGMFCFYCSILILLLVLFFFHDWY